MKVINFQGDLTDISVKRETVELIVDKIYCWMGCNPCCSVMLFSESDKICMTWFDAISCTCVMHRQFVPEWPNQWFGYNTTLILHSVTVHIQARCMNLTPNRLGVRLYTEARIWTAVNTKSPVNILKSKITAATGACIILILRVSVDNVGLCNIYLVFSVIYPGTCSCDCWRMQTGREDIVWRPSS